jgi:integrase
MIRRRWHFVCPIDTPVKVREPMRALQPLDTTSSMASIVRSPKSRYWIGAFRDASGKQHRRSTRETEKKRALAVAQQYERVAKRQGSPQRIRQVFSEFYREHYGQDIPFTSVADYATQWLAGKLPEISSSTFRRYEEAVAKWLAHLGRAADRGMDEVTKMQVASFRDALLSVSSPATTNHALKIVRMVFRAARQEGFLFQDPAEGVRSVKSSNQSDRRPFTIDELRAVLEVADDEWQSLIKCGLYTGQRLADISALTWAQVDLFRNEIRLTTRKTGKKLVIPIAGPLGEHLLSLPAGDVPRSPVHPRAYEIIHAQGGRVGMLSRQFSEILAAAGLREARSHKSRDIGRAGKRQAFELSFHSLRHTAVSLLKDAGIPDAVVMALVGHESVAISQRYTHVGLEALQRAAESLPKI